MFIEKAHSKRLDKKIFAILLLVLPVGFLFLMILNFLMTKDLDSAKMIKDMIDQFGANIAFVLMIIPLSIGFFVVLFWSKIVLGQDIKNLTTARSKVDWKRIFFSFFLWGFLSVLVVFIDYFVNPENYVFNFNLSKFLPFIILSIILIPLQTSFEEYLFRGQLMQGLGILSKNKWFSLLVTSVLFGIMHAANPEVEKLGYLIMVYYIGTGLFLGIITLMDDGLELALGFHAANNLFTALLVTSDWTAFQTHSILKDISEPSAGLTILFPVFVLFPMFLFIFSKKYNWTNWKEKLFGKINNSIEINTYDSTL